MIKRFILKELEMEIAEPEINILLGPRQVGKTTLLHTLEEIARGRKLKTAFFDLEQSPVLAEFNQENDLLIEKIKSAGEVIFIDEFQYLPNASKIFKAIYDSGVKVKLFCSGSSSLEIHKHLKESLAGRRMLFQIFPLQFHEIKMSTSHTSLDEYLVYGGMPGLTHTQDSMRKQKILQELLNAYVLKDVKSLVKEENLRAFNHLMYLLAERQGSVLSVHSLANEVGLSVKAINRYLDILEHTFVLHRVTSYSNNLGNELKKSFKAYIYDLGIRHALLRDYSGIRNRSDKGAILESFVFLALKSVLTPNMEIKFWRTRSGEEVDFILLINRKPVPIEIKSQLNSLEISNGLKKFISRYPAVKQAYVVSSIEGASTLNGCNVEFLKFEEISKIYSGTERAKLQ